MWIISSQFQLWRRSRFAKGHSRFGIVWSQQTRVGDSRSFYRLEEHIHVTPSRYWWEFADVFERWKADGVGSQSGKGQVGNGRKRSSFHAGRDCGSQNASHVRQRGQLACHSLETRRYVVHSDGLVALCSQLGRLECFHLVLGQRHVWQLVSQWYCHLIFVNLFLYHLRVRRCS